MTARIVLASASPRRRELLERVGLVLDVRPANVDEQVVPGEPPTAYVARIARAKADATLRRISPGASGEWVLAADTAVVLDERILGHAETSEEAGMMLRALSGRVHRVLTAFVVIGRRDGSDVVRSGLVATDVVMIAFDEATIADYVTSGEWRGKAGAYAVQGIGAALVREVRGSVTNVIGLPLVEVLAALRDAGGPLPRLAAGTPA